MNMIEAEDRLADAVRLAANPAMAELGYHFRMIDRRLYVAETLRCRITMMLEWSTISMMLKPAGGPSGESAEFQVDIGWVQSPEDILEEVDRQIRYLLRQHRELLEM